MKDRKIQHNLKCVYQVDSISVKIKRNADKSVNKVYLATYKHTYIHTAYILSRQEENVARHTQNCQRKHRPD